MRRTLWPFVIWLLALALPLQGVAAATMAHCAPMRGDAPSVSGHEHAAPGSAPHHHHDAATDTAPSHAAHGVASSDDAGGHGVTSPLHKCSACAACCIGLGLPSTAFELPQAPVARSVPAAPSAHDVAFFTSGPERPPRPHLA